ncbi:hypothetical protein [Parafilimonas sp.]|uniref:hypothetical protein n=1 Tax=Parafilimonas sp. TaxID=1969739 RepID=UPI0039E392C7
MNIIFLCSSLEPGQDGVGDYTRKLAGALIKLGNQAAIAALHDKSIHKGYAEECQHDEDVQVPVIRFSNLFSWKARIAKANDYINRFSPEWISLQYVPYGFSKKGLPFYLPHIIKQLGKNCKWHIMFHEIWTGISALSPIKHKMYGFFQKQVCANLIQMLSPQKITTTNRLYQLALRKKKIYAEVMPLFSNIANGPADHHFLQQIEKENHIHFSDASLLVIGIFGTLYPVAKLYAEIPAHIQKTGAGKKIALVFIGRNNHPGELGKIKKALHNPVQIIELGEMEAAKVSTVFSILHEAILCTPVEHIGKSGAFAALIYHGVKVTAPSSQPIPEYADEISRYNSMLQSKTPVEWGVGAIAGKFARYLSND